MAGVIEQQNISDIEMEGNQEIDTGEPPYPEKPDDDPFLLQPNGGDVVFCDYCFRAVCSECLDDFDVINLPPNTLFKCPSCWQTMHGTKRPYYAFHDLNHKSITPSPTRVTGRYVAPKYAHCNTRSLAIVVFRQTSLSLEGSMPEYLQAHLKTWFLPVGSMLFIDIPFELDINDGKSFKDHAARVHEAIDPILKSDHFYRLVTFVYAHSHSTRGHLYINSTTAIQPSNFFEKVLTEEYLQYAMHFPQEEHWMFMLACGALVNNSHARGNLEATLRKWSIPYTFGFTAPTFNMHLASNFLSIFGTRVIIKGAPLKRKTICQMLDLCWSLRRHGSVVLFRYQFEDDNILCEEYKWYHHKLQPGGEPVGMQCRRCDCIGCLKAYFFKCDNIKTAGIRCTNCTYRLERNVDYEENQIDHYNGSWRLA
ncbi:hypothetical protein FOMPIDRAFT_1049544 [Fomitopsis schrenkii]|uniref:Uncharacterized protein n=1 Tax=Fomitopsis schrenkii TaxID=2126942 RepID=S8FGF4_FOMSC|nr:hypothetical protein FOMPIDRAFT_1049544 [Fomitopsis schrenkii]